MIYEYVSWKYFNISKWPISSERLQLTDLETSLAGVEVKFHTRLFRTNQNTTKILSTTNQKTLYFVVLDCCLFRYNDFRKRSAGRDDNFLAVKFL